MSLSRQILEDEERFFKEIYQSKHVCPESVNLEHFFDGLNTLKQEKADTCQGLAECTNSLKQFNNNKTPGSDGFTIEIYRLFSGMPLVKLWLITLTVLLKMVTCQSHKNAAL